ncbi:hypothetical protein ANN_17568 [Periplaneta americana]|uniref:Tc1-like transposase DDE domain-containing protein n=1 Tax=Periplaneta americana TaxID=6978 RepID=A0ABQ8STA8_PERAM|nr:hypothetical protein ANN_17568 [Periplaneta americana]
MAGLCEGGNEPPGSLKASKRGTVARWVRVFNEGRDRVENMARPGHPSVSEEEVQAVSALSDNDRRETNRLNMRKIATRWVPWDLSEAQRWIRYDTAQTQLVRYDREGDDFLRHIVAFDETWARSYEPLLKRQSNEWRHYGSPRKHVSQNHPILLQDNARAHTAHTVADLYRRWGWEMFFHPPHSAELSSCDYDLIPKMKEPLRDVRFRTVPDILQAIGRSIRNINRTGAATGIIRLPHRWQRVVDNAGYYIEGL